MSLQGRAWESNIRLSLNGNAVTGVAFGSVLVKYRRLGDTSLQSKLVTAQDWYEVGNGLYVVKWSAQDMAKIGPFYFEVTGATFSPHIDEFDVLPSPITSLVTPALCIVSGNIAEIGAQPSPGQAIIFRLAKAPSVVNNAFITGDPLRTVTDAYGNFSVALVRGTKVIVDIERTAIRQQIVIPDRDTANLVDLLPPINNII